MQFFKFLFLLVVLTALCFAATPAHAQVSAGAILGVATDSSGALIPGVSIVVTNQGTNQTRQTVTNDTGNYRVEPLQVGTYTISAELPGFRKEVRADVKVDVDARVRLDFRLEVGNVAEVVEVLGQAPVVQTDDSQVGQVVDQRKIADLPLNGRNFSQLAYITPGTFAPRPGSHLSDRGGFVAAGLAEKTNQFMIDGINNNSHGTMEPVMRINIDTVAEFKIQTQNYTAQYGRFAGAQVDTIIKSGTNAFHGSVFGFTRNDNLDARNFFDPWPLEKKAEFKRHQYGGVLGGPIQRDKFFFFAGFQGQRQIQFRTTKPTVPLPEFWSGDLSRLNKVIRDPRTGQPFPNNQIPRDRIHPVALNFRPLWPAPTESSLVRNSTAFIPEPFHFWQVNWKLNYNFSDKHQLVGSYNFYSDKRLEWNIAGNPEVPGFMTDGRLHNQHLSIQDVYTLSPTVINEFRVGFSRLGRFRYPEQRERNYAREFGISGTTGDIDPMGYGHPWIAITGYSRIGTTSTQPSVPGQQMMADVLSIQRANHAIKLGGDAMRQRMELTILSNQAGRFNFTGSTSGDAFADFLLGYPDEALRSPPLGPLSQHPRRWSSNWFIQDDWKAASNLTFNVGLRYELTFPLEEKWDKLSSFDPTIGGGKGGIRLVGKAARFQEAIAFYKNLYPTLLFEYADSYYKTDVNNFAPRFGFAWTPSGRNDTVVRGGYGVFYTIDALCFCSSYNQAPFTLSQRFTKQDGPTWDNPWPGRGVGAIDMGGNYSSGLVNAYYQHWNLGVQRELPAGLVLDVSYVGKKGTHIDASRDINQPINRVKPYPLFGPISYTEPRGSSSYHGMQLRVERRSSSGVTVLGSYAWSKLIDNIGPVRDAYNLRAERGPGTEDMRHRLTTSFVLPLPVGRGQSGVLNGIIGGWELSGIMRANSGSPLTPTVSRDFSGIGRRADRPNIVGQVSLGSAAHPRTGWWNRAAFTLPETGTFGNAGKGSIIGPGYFGTDFSLLKRFNISEDAAVQLRFEVFNVFNQANFWSPRTVFDAADFGTIGTALENRQIQLGMKVIF